MVESSSDDILKDADRVDVAFLVVGDPFGYAIYTSNVPSTSNILTEQQHIPTSFSAPASSLFLHAPFPMPVS
jgi:diphthine synthase